MHDPEDTMSQLCVHDRCGSVIHAHTIRLLVQRATGEAPCIEVRQRRRRAGHCEDALRIPAGSTSRNALICSNLVGFASVTTWKVVTCVDYKASLASTPQWIFVESGFVDEGFWLLQERRIPLVSDRRRCSHPVSGLSRFDWSS